MAHLPVGQLVFPVSRLPRIKSGHYINSARNDAVINLKGLLSLIPPLHNLLAETHNTFKKNIQWGKKVFNQPPIVQVLPLKIWERPVIHHRYTSTMTNKMRFFFSRKSHRRIFNDFFCKLCWKISIWSPTNKQDFWLSQTCNFFFKRLLCPPLVTCINGTCLNLLSV